MSEKLAPAIDAELSQKIADTIRWLSADGVQAANSGHPGLPMGCSDIAAVLLTRALNIDPNDDKWFNRDRFILSAGHGSMLLYSMLHLAGYIPLEELKKFRQLDSLTPGHPELFHTKGVDFTTGPLGAGFTAATGMALGERMLGEMYNTSSHDITDHYTYVVMGDGCNQEGITQEAASLAGHLKLGKLIAFYDSNGIQIDGKTEICFTENVGMRYEADGWHVQRIDGHDHAAIAAAIEAAKAETGKPSLIVATTNIGRGAPNKEGQPSAHGAPLGPDEIAAGKAAIGWSDESFQVPAEVSAFFEKRKEQWIATRKEWDALLADFKSKEKDTAKEYTRVMSGELPVDWTKSTPEFASDFVAATRASGGQILADFAEAVPELVGGSADLVESNKTFISKGAFTDKAFVEPGVYLARNIHYGVREHAMGQISNGLAAHGGFIPFCATFFVFSDYLRPAIRMSALSKLQTLYVFTHDSIYVGEDGPTHQPIEHLAALRCIPNVDTFRPADANEAAYAYQYALAKKDGPTVITLTRQNLATIDRATHTPAKETLKGGYILEKTTDETAEICIIATGSEVSLAQEVAQSLRDSGRNVRVVSMPCLDLFKAQSAEYRQQVLPSSMSKRVVIEAGVAQGWEGILGDNGIFIGMDDFGTSAPAKLVGEKYGFTAKSVLAKISEAGF